MITIGCKNNQAHTEAPASLEASEDIVEKDVVEPEVNDRQDMRLLQDACSLISPKYIARVLGVDQGSINVKEGSKTGRTIARSCFFKWESEIPNGGILVQIQKNPVPDDFPEYVQYFISTKKREGENSFSEGGYVYEFTDWGTVGDEGAYSSEAGKYYWRLGNEYIFMLAFNLALEESEQLAAANKLAPEIMKNFNG
jgi:hypothetical protein